MIAALRGIVAAQHGQTLVVDVSGVGYEVYCSRRCVERWSVGDECALVVHTEVREDAIRLFGFVDQQEKQIFNLLLHVKGIGAKTASEIISALDTRELLRAIAHGDLARLQATKGIGKKTAERILVELKEKVAEYALEGYTGERVASDDGAYRDASEALKALGFPRDEIERALKQVRGMTAGGSRDSSELVREALRCM